MIHLYFGFHAPYFRNLEGRIDPRGWFGHCEVWGYNDDETWVFLDPQAKGLTMMAVHRRDDVIDQLHARFALCETILKIEPKGEFALPLHGLMTCASVCGALVGVRALIPAGLRRKLISKGAEIVHEAERRSQGQSRAGA